MTEDEFRAIALGLPEAEERAHMGHPDFRVGGKIFATLRAPREGFGMVKLTPDDQERFMSADPKAFVPAAGKWGQRGCTYVELSVAKKNMIKDAVAKAWRATAPKRLLKS